MATAEVCSGGNRATMVEGHSPEVTDMDESRRAWVMIGTVIAVVLLNLAAIILMNTLGR